LKDKEWDERKFYEIARYFLRGNGNVKTISIERVSDYHPFTRILRVQYLDGKEEKFVIKILKSKRSNSDKNVLDLLHEVAVQEKLKELGFQVRDYLLIETSENNLLGFPFAIGTYLEGVSLNKESPERIVRVLPKVLDYLYKLHSTTVSNSFGYPDWSPKGRGKKIKDRFGEFESKYLLADIKRDNIEFTPSEKKVLLRAINSLNRAKLFCLCHCDVTLSNIIWNGRGVHLIDWSYSHFTEPMFDVAYVIFWLLEFGFLDQAEREIRRSFKKYERLGFDFVPRFLFYLAHKYIEFGRFKGKAYIERGKKLLKAVPSRSLEEILRNCTEIFQNPSN
jgi:thiamine kinase-like enzyme